MSKPLVTRTKEQLNILKEYAVDNNLPANIYSDFCVFAKHIIPKWGDAKLDWEWFHYYQCKYYQSIIDGNVDFMSVEIAPQHGKSVLLTLFVCYLFGINPNLKVIYFTYSEDRATEVVKSYILNFMSSDKYKKIFPHVLLKADLPTHNLDNKTKMQRKTATLKDNEFTLSDQFGNNYMGKLMAYGVGQGTQGKASDISLIDDFVSSGEKTSSVSFRTKLQRWFYTDCISRFQPNTKMIIVCTRWYFNDLVGLLKHEMQKIYEIMNKMGEIPPNYKEIRIRAEYRLYDDNIPEDPRKEDGDWLWKPFLTKYLLAKGSDDFNAMYNCDPTDTDNTQQLQASDFGYYDKLPLGVGRYIFSVDGASTDKSKSDFTAIGLWYIVGNKRYLVKLWSIKMQIIPMIKFVTNLLTEEYPYPFWNDCLIEHASGGIALCQSLAEQGIKHTPLSFNGVEVGKVNTDKKGITRNTNSKLDRYLRVISEFKHADKRILLPNNKIEFQDEFINQMITFNGEAGRKDDFVDMATYLIYHTKKNVIKHTPLTSNNNSHYNNLNYTLNNFNTNLNYFK